jgi:cytochrome c
MRSLNVYLAAAAAVTVTACAGMDATSSSESKLEARPRAAYGKPISQAELASWDIDIRTKDGKGLPPGSGSVAQGKQVYDVKCVACHGPDAKGGSQYGSMVGGIGSFTTNKRVLTPGSMYPYAPILFDYIRRAMPMTNPQSLTNDEVYALSAYILHLNGLVPADAVMDAKSLAAVEMPNRNGFIPDTRPDVHEARCMSNCPPIR